MFETGYPFRLSTKQLVGNDYPLIEKLIYTFNTTKNRQYLVEVHRYEYRVYVIKFHDKNHSRSDDRYNFVLNDFDAGHVLRTILAIALEVLKNDEFASFAFVGARKNKEAPDASKTQRFRIYKRIAEYFLGNQTFLHSYEERSNSYLLVNKKNEKPEVISETIIDMFAKIFQGIEHL
jgi:hypothetical protein